MTVDDQIMDLIKKMNAFEKRAIKAEEELTQANNTIKHLEKTIRDS